MKKILSLRKAFLAILVVVPLISIAQSGNKPGKITFPDIPGYQTLKCDFHMHTVLSDGAVWPNIRVEEALREGLDAISITDHLEYQPHKADIPHPDRNRSYELAMESARGKDLLVINGVEITRSMPPGHFNAIFVEDANRLMDEDAMEVFREARKQDAFVIWNHPHWTAQSENGMLPLSPVHDELINEGLMQGIEVYNEYTYSDEALAFAQEHGLSIMGCSDVHGLVNSTFGLDRGGHRPVTLVFAENKDLPSLKKALFGGQTAVWFDNTLVGNEQWLSPLLRSCLTMTKKGQSLVQEVLLENKSDADLVLRNTSDFSLHNKASVFILKAHSSLSVFVKTVEKMEEFELSFEVLNAFIAADRHPEISYLVK